MKKQINFGTYHILILLLQVTFTASIDKSKPLILAWNKWWREESLFNSLENITNIANKKCPFQCDYSEDRSDEDSASMVVFHIACCGFSGWPFSEWPKRRTDSQYYVMYSRESPVYSVVYYDRTIMTDTWFNVTVTYRADSTVFYPYNQIMPITPDTPEWDIWSEGEIAKQIAKKSKLAFQAVSHCGAPSGRDALVDQLRDHIQIDQFGKCNSQPCDQECYGREMENHFFYLAFENSICPQYVTEKFWTALRSLTVPVVLKRSVFDGVVVPQNAFIAADDFGDDVRALAGNLSAISEDAELYKSYFNWTKLYRKSPYAHPYSPLCQLCEIAKGQAKRTVDLAKFWTTTECQSFGETQNVFHFFIAFSIIILPILLLLFLHFRKLLFPIILFLVNNLKTYKNCTICCVIM